MIQFQLELLQIQAQNIPKTEAQRDVEQPEENFQTILQQANLKQNETLIQQINPNIANNNQQQIFVNKSTDKTEKTDKIKSQIPNQSPNQASNQASNQISRKITEEVLDQTPDQILAQQTKTQEKLSQNHIFQQNPQRNITAQTNEYIKQTKTQQNEQSKQISQNTQPIKNQTLNNLDNLAHKNLKPENILIQEEVASKQDLTNKTQKQIQPVFVETQKNNQNNISINQSEKENFQPEKITLNFNPDKSQKEINLPQKQQKSQNNQDYIQSENQKNLNQKNLNSSNFNSSNFNSSNLKQTQQLQTPKQISIKINEQQTKQSENHALEQKTQQIENDFKINKTIYEQPAQTQNDISQTKQTNIDAKLPKIQNSGEVLYEIKQNIKNGNHNFSVKLQPQNLGKIDINVAFEQQGKVQINFKFDNYNAMEWMKTNTPMLEKALEITGINQDKAALNFQMNEQQNQTEKQFSNNQQQNLSYQQEEQRQNNNKKYQNYNPHKQENVSPVNQPVELKQLNKIDIRV